MKRAERLNPAALRTMHQGELDSYAALSGDLNPIHGDHAQAVKAGHPGVICHGMLSMTDIGHWLIGEMKGRRLITISCRFVAPMSVGTRLTVSGVCTAQRTDDGDGIAVDGIAVDFVAKETEGEIRVTGRAVFV
ncbi:MAG: dehydratase [Halomonas sp. 54_146]|nr:MULTISPECIES: MaoC/PaaZ C-terminal domain-containing protein [unclassified Halomonas]KUJ88946.1 MAG: dehydratase [Halomonas sp. 54_146]HAA46753.1 hypothetical protein [Halomonas sp.]